MIAYVSDISSCTALAALLPNICSGSVCGWHKWRWCSKQQRRSSSSHQATYQQCCQAVCTGVDDGGCCSSIGAVGLMRWVEALALHCCVSTVFGAVCFKCTGRLRLSLWTVLVASAQHAAATQLQPEQPASHPAAVLAGCLRRRGWLVLQQQGWLLRCGCDEI